MERHEVVVGDVRLVCQLTGAPDAPPMVLLHALGERGASWHGVLPKFEAFFRVVTIDLRGHGDSDRPGHYSYGLMRDDVLGVLDQLGMDRITLVGHSMGGVVSYLIAEEHPGRIERLVLEDTPPPFPTDRAIPERPDEPVPFDWPVVPAILGHVPDPVWWDRLTEITAPTLLVGGGPTSHIPHSKLEEVAAQVPQCTLLTIPAGHHVHATKPAEFAAAVVDFTVGRAPQARTG